MTEDTKEEPMVDGRDAGWGRPDVTPAHWLVAEGTPRADGAEGTRAHGHARVGPVLVTVVARAMGAKAAEAAARAVQVTLSTAGTILPAANHDIDGSRGALARGISRRWRAGAVDGEQGVCHVLVGLSGRQGVRILAFGQGTGLVVVDDEVVALPPPGPGHRGGGDLGDPDSAQQVRTVGVGSDRSPRLLWLSTAPEDGVRGPRGEALEAAVVSAANRLAAPGPFVGPDLPDWLGAGMPCATGEVALAWPSATGALPPAAAPWKDTRRAAAASPLAGPVGGGLGAAAMATGPEEVDADPETGGAPAADDAGDEPVDPQIASEEGSSGPGPDVGPDERSPVPDPARSDETIVMAPVAQDEAGATTQVIPVLGPAWDDREDPEGPDHQDPPRDADRVGNWPDDDHWAGHDMDQEWDEERSRFPRVLVMGLLAVLVSAIAIAAWGISRPDQQTDRAPTRTPTTPATGSPTPSLTRSSNSSTPSVTESSAGPSPSPSVSSSTPTPTPSPSRRPTTAPPPASTSVAPTPTPEPSTPSPSTSQSSSTATPTATDTATATPSPTPTPTETSPSPGG